jgi:hypothetical protein
MNFCALCGGKGRNPDNSVCLNCMGKGWVESPDPWKTPTARSSGGSSSANDMSALIVVGAVIAALGALASAYVVSTAILLHYWNGSYWGPHRLAWAGTFFVAGLALSFATSQVFGILAGTCVGLIPAMPLIEALRFNNVGFWYLVLHERAPLSPSGKWPSVAGLTVIILIHGYVSWRARPREAGLIRNLVDWPGSGSRYRWAAAIAIIAILAGAALTMSDAIAALPNRHS